VEIRFCAHVPKDLARPEEVEDACQADLERSVVALADGASESFASSAWARILVDEYTRDPTLGLEFMHRSRMRYETEVGGRSRSWAQQASYDRGSFSTLLGVQYHSDASRLNVVCVGDSAAVVLAGSCPAVMLPDEDPRAYSERPTLLPTRLDQEEVALLACRAYRIHFRHAPHDILLMTDALAEWAFRQAADGDGQWERLCSLREDGDLAKLVVRERNARRLRTDDVTLVHLRIGYNGLPDARTV
jgi:hypothetical protein